MHAQLLNSQCATAICHHTYLNCNHHGHNHSLLGHNLWDDHSENNKQFQVIKIAVPIVHYFTYEYLAYEYCFLCLEASIVSFHFVTHTNSLFALVKDRIDVHLCNKQSSQMCSNLFLDYFLTHLPSSFLNTHL